MARDRYLWNAGEETINDPKFEIKKPETPKSKWENFWFYHKWHMLAVVVVAFIVGTLVYDISTKVDPDYQVALLTQENYPQEMLDQLSSELSKYGYDLNGDGSVIVQINSYVLVQGEETSSEPQDLEEATAQQIDPYTQMASVTKFSADLQTGESLIFLTDNESFLQQSERGGLFAYFDGSRPEDGATDYENMRLPWSECKGLASIKLEFGPDSFVTSEQAQEYLDGLSLSMRAFEGTQLAEKKGKQAYYEQSKEFYDRLVSGEPAVSEESEQK